MNLLKSENRNSRLLRNILFTFYVSAGLLILNPPEGLWNFSLFDRYDFYFRALIVAVTGILFLIGTVRRKEVDAFVTDGKAKILCVSNSDKILDDNRFVIYRGKSPANASSSVLREIEEVTQKIVDAFQLKNCPLLIQMINDGKHVSVLEFCARTGGNTKYLLIRYSCGVDVIEAAIDLSMGKIPEIKPVETGNTYVVNDFIYCRPGVFDHLAGFEELKKQGVINEYHAIRGRGTQVMGVRSSSDRIATYNITARTKEELNQKIRKAAADARIETEDGTDLMRHDLIPEVR